MTKPKTVREVLDRSVSERAFQAAVIEMAQRLHWLVFHASDRAPSEENRDYRALEAGFPDLVLVKGGVLIFAELKTDTGKLRAQQARWLLALDSVAANHAPDEPFDMDADEARALSCVKVKLWRPRDWPEIEETLRG